MQPDEIIQQLTEAEELPVEALCAAAEHRDKLVPSFLAEFERFPSADIGVQFGPSPLFYAFHLLGEWGETSAYRPLARFLRAPPEAIEYVLGDATTETAHRVMASVFDGDLQPLHDIVADRGAEQFVRGAMCQTVAVLALNGRLDLAEAEGFLRDAFATIERRGASSVWTGWEQAVAALGLSAMTPLVREAYDRHYIGIEWGEFEEFEEDLQSALDTPRHLTDPSYTPFSDTIEALSGWSIAQDQNAEAFEDWPAFDDERWHGLEDELLPPQPAANPYRGVGRNDPCPCGSGKKFKRCCLGATPI